MGMNEPLPYAFESRQQRRGNIARAVREMLGMDLKQAGRMAGIGGSDVAWFEMGRARYFPSDFASTLGAGYEHAGAGWSRSSVFLTKGAAQDRFAIRAALALACRLPETLAREVERETGIPDMEIRAALSRYGPMPSPVIVLACMDLLATGMKKGCCNFEAAPMGGWRKVSFLGRTGQ